ncbi:MAG: alcohol dehydrogenase catalytic domain-containing protein [Bryobacteraceae bacterium]
MTQTNTLAAREAHGKLEPFSYDPGPLGDDQVEIEVKYCGVCHSDLSMLNDDWGITAYPFVPGHEAIGIVSAAGTGAKGIRVG